MNDKFAFLQPWRAAIRECKALHDSIYIVDSREFRASQLPVHASIRCWLTLPKGYEQLAGRCSIPVPFPADAALRGDRERLRRIREAMELFNVLAAVSRPAFLKLMAEVIVVADNFDDLFTSPYIFVYPVWECYLVGTLRSDDVVAQTGVTTWGQLFGCDEDPLQYSEDFRCALEQLEVMRRQMTGVLCAFVKEKKAKVEWSNPSNVIEWTAEHVAVPTKGTLVTPRSKADTQLKDSFSRELGALLKTEVPSVVQLCAVSDAMELMKMWEGLPLNATPVSVEMMKPRFAELGGAQVTVALSRMNLSTLRLNLDEVVESGEASKNAASLLSTLVCGRSLCEDSRGENSAPLLQRRGTINELDVVFARNSVGGPAGICSALVESSSIHHLTLNIGILGDSARWFNQVRWGWLAYALWSSASNTSIEAARLTNVHLSTSTVASVAAVLTNCYPPSLREQNMADPAVYGFIDVQEGTKLRPCGLDASDNSSIVISSGYRCRARYDPADLRGQAEVVVPGYGVCLLQLGDGVNMCIPDYVKPQYKVNGSAGLRYLTLEFFEIENPSLIPSLLSLIGGNLRSLKMGMFWTGRRRSILLDSVAAACPNLEELSLMGFDVVVANSKDLQNWGLKKLFIESSEEVAGLSECLGDPGYRMARELEELEIIIPRSSQMGAAYIGALRSHSGGYVAAVEDKLPLKSKAAMISVVDAVESRTDTIKVTHRLNETLIGYIFAFAATPKRRVVRIVL